MSDNFSEFHHTYTYNTDGTLATDTAIDSAGNTWVKTFTYSSGSLVNETNWVKQ